MMEKMKQYFQSFSFMVGFMITCIFMQMTLGGKFLNKFLWLVLFGMVITNHQEFIKTVQAMTEIKTTESTKDPAWTPEKDDKGTVTAGYKIGLKGSTYL